MVHVPNNWVLGGLAIGNVVLVLTKYMILEYLVTRVTVTQNVGTPALERLDCV